MNELPDPTGVTTWPAALVTIVMILALLVVPSVLTYLGNQRVKAVENTLTNTNGGSTVKDALNRIEGTLSDDVLPAIEDQAARIAALEAARIPSGIVGLFRRS